MRRSAALTWSVWCCPGRVPGTSCGRWTFDEAKSLTSLVDSPEDPQVQQLLSGFRQLTAQHAGRRLDARLTKKGRTLVSVVDEGRVPDLRHDRSKHTLLPADAPFLEVLGL